jgi:hypothetical protein
MERGIRFREILEKNLHLENNGGIYFNGKKIYQSTIVLSINEARNRTKSKNEDYIQYKDAYDEYLINLICDRRFEEYDEELCERITSVIREEQINNIIS